MQYGAPACPHTVKGCPATEIEQNWHASTMHNTMPYKSTCVTCIKLTIHKLSTTIGISDECAANTLIAAQSEKAAVRVLLL
jgi:hypothetical protein